MRKVNLIVRGLSLGSLRDIGMNTLQVSQFVRWLTGKAPSLTPLMLKLCMGAMIPQRLRGLSFTVVIGNLRPAAPVM